MLVVVQSEQAEPWRWDAHIPRLSRRSSWPAFADPGLADAGESVSSWPAPYECFRYGLSLWNRVL